jgi:two-component system chemotaxis response regulator CheY
MARVLIVDDLEELRTLSRVRLERSGHVVVAEASNGRDAIEAAKTHQPDLVVLDVMMPELTGLQALPDIAAAAPGAKILVFSSLPTLQLSEVRSLGGHGLLDKIDQFRLVDEVARLLDG